MEAGRTQALETDQPASDPGLRLRAVGHGETSLFRTPVSLHVGQRSVSHDRLRRRCKG